MSCARGYEADIPLFVHGTAPLVFGAVCRWYVLCRDQLRLQAANRYYLTSPALTLVFRIVRQQSKTESQDRGSRLPPMMGAQYIVNLAGHCWPQSAYYNMPTLSSAGGTAITCRQVCYLSIDRCQPKSALRQDWPVSLPRHTFAKFSLHVDHSGTSSRIFNETAKTGLISLQIVLHPGPAVVVVTKASRTAFAS